MTGEDTSIGLNPQLTYFLQNYLHWKDLNNLQKETIPLIAEDDDLLIIAPTASGKTESALIPIYNQILNQHLTGTSTLYIAPLKALINDMYLRINYWNKHFGLTATKWHGDVNRSKKLKYISDPTNFLLITPESLEVILINQNNDVKEKIFQNIKYIIIDEIHYFADSERGIQLNSLLTRISEYTGNTLKIGLSATLGNPEEVSKWINYDKPAKIIQHTNQRDIKFKIVKYQDYEDIPKFLYKYRSKKILLFAKSRNGVEFYYNIIKKYFKGNNVFLHHASISKELRQKNEEAFRNAENGIMISTSTLELGIDIGNIDIVSQISTTDTISSFLQRIGRGGRRSDIQRVLLFINSETDAILTLAQISLINKNIVENVNIRKKAKDIYLHQILSMVFEATRINFKEVYYKLSNSYCFSEISKDEFRTIIKYLIETDILQLNHGLLSLSYEFEQEFGKINFMDFYSVFPTTAQYTIKKGKEIIGELDYLYIMGLNENDTFILGGNCWEVTSINRDKFIINVKEGSEAKSIPNWASGKKMLNYLITREVYKILLGDFDVSLLNLIDEEYCEDILEWNQTLSQINLDENSLPIKIDVKDKTSRIELFTFGGSYVNFLFVHIISKEFNITYTTVFPISFTIHTDSNVEDILEYLYGLKDNVDVYLNDLIVDFSKEEVSSKFIDYLPEDEKDDVIKEILFNIEDFKELINNCNIVLLDDYNVNINFNSLDL